jgi:hypothetical protein
MVTRSFEIVFPSPLRRALVGAAALTLLVGVTGCDSDSDTKTGNASVKFCNNLTSQAGPIEFTLMIGNPPVSLKAATGQCSSAVGVGCATVNAGAVPWRVLFEGKVTLAGTTPMYNAEDFVFVATLDQGQAVIVDGLIEDGTKCAQLNPFEGAAPGAGGSGGTVPPRAADRSSRTVIPLPIDAEAYRHLGLERHSPR